MPLLGATKKTRDNLSKNEYFRRKIIVNNKSNPKSEIPDRTCILQNHGIVL